MRKNWAAKITLILISLLMILCSLFILLNSKLLWTGVIIPDEFRSSDNSNSILISGVLNENGATLAEMITVINYDGEQQLGALYIPGITFVGEDTVRYGRINGAFNWGSKPEGTTGVSAVACCVNKLLCMPVDNYLTFDMKILPQVTDILEGINFSIESDLPFEDRILEAGELQFSSKEVLRYILSDSRENVSSVNYLRACFMEALIERICTLKTKELLSLLWQCRKGIDTDLTLREAISLSISSSNMHDCEIDWFLIPGFIRTGYGQENITVWSVDRRSAAEMINSVMKYNTDKILVEDLLIPELTA